MKGKIPSSDVISDEIFLCRYVKTTANATVDHLSKYLALRIALEDRGPEEGGGGEEGVAGETGGTAGVGEGSSLNNVSEKQYTIYIMTRGGQFSVSVQTCCFLQRPKYLYIYNIHTLI